MPYLHQTPNDAYKDYLLGAGWKETDLVPDLEEVVMALAQQIDNLATRVKNLAEQVRQNATDPSEHWRL
jgi:hypothetical protein